MPAHGLAILGSGIFAKEAHLPALAALGGAVDVKAVYSRSRKSSTEFAEAAQEKLGLKHKLDVYNEEDEGRSLDSLLARPDIKAVIVVLPITLQPDIVRKALAAGKHVLSEKPVAPDVASGRALIEEYEAKYKPQGLVWRVAENFETEPGFQAAQRIVHGGKLGTIKYYNARAYSWVDTHSKWYNTPWRTVPDYQGGFLLDGGVHTIAVLRKVLPSSFTSLSAYASLAKDILKPHDTINAVVASDDNSHGIIELSWGTPVQSRVTEAHSSISITGDKGWLEATRVGENIRVVVRTAVLDENGKPVWDEEKKLWKETEEVIEEKSCGVEKEIESWLRAVDGEDDGLDAPRGTLVDVAFIEAALNSKGTPVDLKKLVTG
ncbi:oxidoreductase family protein [Polyporus arcularius HHB13444]|uniref:Oxidoreductase family protein n=1 Tax=Polyporus arcularius HHB13444 TaxID=1314778 RepID=A0A5C3P990_9APHY|nr:oxidoreductase family protein [Polyporus arcularius HHB13444]